MPSRDKRGIHPKDIAGELANLEGSLAALRAELVQADPYGAKSFTVGSSRQCIERLENIEAQISVLKAKVQSIS